MTQPPKHILVAVLDWGLGHATRSMVVINALINRGCKVSVAGNGQSLELLKQEYPTLNYYHLEPYNIFYSKTWPLILKLFSQLPKLYTSIKVEHQQIEQLVAEQKFDAIISDNRFGCWSKKIPGVFITHQVNLQVNPIVNDWVNHLNRKRIKRFTACWIPDFETDSVTGKLSETNNLNARFIGMLSRFKSTGIQEDQNLLVGIVSGPEPQRTVFEELLIGEMEKQSKQCIIVRGIPDGKERKHDRITFINHLKSNDLSDLLQKAGTIVSRSGYSTIMDLSALGKRKIIFVPTPGQTEQEYLAKQLNQKKIALMQKQSAIDLAKGLVEVREFTGFNKMKENDLLDKALMEIIN